MKNSTAKAIRRLERRIETLEKLAAQQLAVQMSVKDMEDLVKKAETANEKK